MKDMNLRFKVLTSIIGENTPTPRHFTVKFQNSRGKKRILRKKKVFIQRMNNLNVTGNEKTMIHSLQSAKEMVMFNLEIFIRPTITILCEDKR